MRNLVACLGILVLAGCTTEQWDTFLDPTGSYDSASQPSSGGQNFQAIFAGIAAASQARSNADAAQIQILQQQQRPLYTPPQYTNCQWVGGYLPNFPRHLQCMTTEGY